jgi:hypothetical protein
LLLSDARESRLRGQFEPQLRAFVVHGERPRRFVHRGLERGFDRVLATAKAARANLLRHLFPDGVMATAYFSK